MEPDTKKVYKSNVGIPQGSVVSPILANIVLHELDKYSMNSIIPKYTKGKRRRTNPEYNKLIPLRYSRKGVRTGESSKEALKKMRTIPRMDLYDRGFRRAMYIRYADDFVFLLEGTKLEALAIRESIRVILKEKCGLGLNMLKTDVTNTSDGFNFLERVSRN